MFVDIKGYVGIYKISPNGEIFSSYQSRLLSGWIGAPGYKQVSLWKDGKHKKYCIHRLLAITFLPNPTNLPEVNHINGDKLNNDLSNLEWVTGSQNVQHAFARGLNSKSACVDYAKLPSLIEEVISGTTLREICNRENILETSTLRKLLLREATRTGLKEQFVAGTRIAKQSIVTRRSHAISKKDSNGNLSEIFDSINAAARSLNKNPTSIWKAVKSGKIYMGHYWERVIA